MLANILIPIALFCITLGAAYFARGIGVWEILASCVVAGIGSLATQGFTSSGLFASSRQPRQEAQNEGRAEKARQEELTRKEEITKEATRLKEAREGLVDHWDLPSDGAKATQRILQSEPDLAKDKTLMESVLSNAIHDHNIGSIKAVLQANPELHAMDIRIGEIKQPLVFGVLKDHASILNYLINKFPDVLSQRNSNNDTPVLAAAKSGNDVALSVIGDSSPSCLLQTDELGRSVLYLFLRSCRDGEEVVVGTARKLLAKNPAIAAQRDRDGRTVADCLRQTGFVKFDDQELYQKLLKSLEEAERKSKPARANERPISRDPVTLMLQLQCSDVLDVEMIGNSPLPNLRDRVPGSRRPCCNKT